MLGLISAIIIFYSFMISSSACSRIIQIHLTHTTIDIDLISIILVTRLLGTFIASYTFNKIIKRLGVLRTFVISVICFTQSIIFLLLIKSEYLYIATSFLFGLFETYAIFIIKPTLRIITEKYKRQVNIIFQQIARFSAVFLLKLKKHIFLPMLMFLSLFAVIPYVLSDARNFFKKEYVDTESPNLYVVYNEYPLYFIFAFFLHLSSVSASAYILILVQNITQNISFNYLLCFFLGHVIFSIPLEIFLNYLSMRKRILAVNLLIIASTALTATILFFYKSNILLQYICLSLFGGSLSSSSTLVLNRSIKKIHVLSVDITDDQIKMLATFIAICINISILKRFTFGWFFVIITNHFLCILYLFYKKWFKKDAKKLIQSI
jgi:hypothetical protein